MSNMKTPLPLAGYDCETTGTDVSSSRIISAALVQRTGDGQTATTTWLIDPGVEIPAAAEAVHGISTAHVRAHGADPATALDEIAANLAACLDAGLPIVIYNAMFDLRIMDAELARHNLPSLSQRVGRPIQPVLDPLVIDRGVDRYRRGSRKLPDLIRFYGLAPAKHAHDATDDVINTIAVLDAILDRHRELPDDLAALHAWQSARHAEWAKHHNEWTASQGRRPTADPHWP